MEQRISIERMEQAVNIFGSFDENIRLLETEFQVQVVNRGGEIVVSGEPENVMLAEKGIPPEGPYCRRDVCGKERCL